MENENIVNLGHWVCNIEVPAEFFGFVYLITNNANGRKYIGKKQSVSRYRKPLKKGKKKREIVMKQSDWMTYMGSCADLIADIEKYGKSSFTFEILRFCNSKWELGYYEIREQIDKNVLMDPLYYNGIINCRLCKLKQYR